jgi:hypothetical protein
MANALQLRRGTTTQHSTFTGLAGEVTVDTTKDTVVVHDGSTAGGIPLATESYVGTEISTEIANLVASAPSTLDTLNELAAALGDDPNFATTVTNSIAGKLATAGGTMTGNVTFNDNARIRLGTGNDLDIYHDGSNSYIKNNSGVLRIHGTEVQIKDEDNNETLALFTPQGAVTLYYDNSSKFTTTSLGAVIGGGTAGEIQLPSSDYIIRGGTNYGDIRIDAPRFRVYESGNLCLAVDGQDTLFYDTGGVADLRWDASASALAFADGSKANFGNSADLQIYHDGSNSVINEAGTGNLVLYTNGTSFLVDSNAGENMIQATPNGAVNLYYDNSNKLQTTSTGANVSGTLTTDGVTVDGTLEINEVFEKFHTGASNAGTLLVDTSAHAIVYLTSNQAANRTLNFINVNSNLDTGQSLTATVLATQGSTAYYFNAYQVDSSAVTPKWSGGSAPTEGNASGIDVYTFTIIKTANATFTVLASVTQYA